MKGASLFSGGGISLAHGGENNQAINQNSWRLK